MSTILCNKCGGTTNTALSDHINSPFKGKAERCFARWENNKWVEGCAFNDKDDVFMINFAKKIINNSSVKE